MDQDLLTLLRSVDTPTVCNAIEVAEGKRGFNRFTRGMVLASAPEAGAIVGYARTAKIAANEPPKEDPAVIRARRMDMPDDRQKRLEPRQLVSFRPPHVVEIEHELQVRRIHFRDNGLGLRRGGEEIAWCIEGIERLDQDDEVFSRCDLCRESQCLAEGIFGRGPL